MKILQIINAFETAGAEKLMVEISKRYIKEGHQVDLLLLKSINSGLEQEAIAYKGIGVHFLSENTNIYNPINILRIRKFLKNSDYDVLHAHLFPTFYWVAFALGDYFKGLAVHTEHNTTNRRMASPLFGWVDKFIYPKFDYHVTISDAVRQNLEEHISFDSNRLVNIYNGIDLDTIVNAQGYDKSHFGLESDNKIILQVSAFRPQKDQATLIKTMEYLDPKIHLFFAGKGEMKDECVALSKELNIEDRVHFLGVRNDIPKLLKTADIVVLSSFYEGLSLSSVEGMASGKPFVASDVPGLHEVVHGAGILFDQGDVKGLTNSISELFSNEDHYNKTALNCRERSKKYDIKLMVTEYLKLYLRQKVR